MRWEDRVDKIKHLTLWRGFFFHFSLYPLLFILEDETRVTSNKNQKGQYYRRIVAYRFVFFWKLRQVKMKRLDLNLEKEHQSCNEVKREKNTCRLKAFFHRAKRMLGCKKERWRREKTTKRRREGAKRRERRR